MSNEAYTTTDKTMKQILIKITLDGNLTKQQIESELSCINQDGVWFVIEILSKETFDFNHWMKANIHLVNDEENNNFDPINLNNTWFEFWNQDETECNQFCLEVKI